MEKYQKKRRFPRESLQPPNFGIICAKKKSSLHRDSQDETDTMYVNVLNVSERGLLLQSPQRYKVNSTLDMEICHPHSKVWTGIKGRVKWTDDIPSKSGYFRLGIEYHKHNLGEHGTTKMDRAQKKHILPSDLEFLLNTNLFAAIPRESVTPLLNSLKFKKVRTGERFITQGDDGDTFYIIQNGACIINLEKDNTLNPVARLKAGDIVGEMAVLTGECRSTHVDAETDMDLWSLTRQQFDTLAQEYPDLRNFLTEIVTQRFSSVKITASRTIGKYIIKEILDQGGWSIVYRGAHNVLNFQVAVKMLKHNMAMDPEFLDKFRYEAKTIARLNHPNIVKVYDIEERYRTLFIIMELLEGYPLKYLLTNMPKLSISGIVDIILQVCSGLEYAHKEGIIHQDIKPANIFIQPDGLVRIVDFGLACPPGTIDFDMPGTPFYMSPEQIRGEPVDERTDIYSLGIMLYEMLTGKRPFPEESLGKLMDLHVKEDTPDPRILIPDMPEELHSVIMKSIRKDPGERFHNIPEIVNKLRPLADKMGLKFRMQERKKGKIMGLFLFYRDEHQLDLNRLINKLNNDIADIGAVLRITHIEDI